MEIVMEGTELLKGQEKAKQRGEKEEKERKWEHSRTKGWWAVAPQPISDQKFGYTGEEVMLVAGQSENWSRGRYCFERNGADFYFGP